MNSLNAMFTIVPRFLYHNIYNYSQNCNNNERLLEFWVKFAQNALFNNMLYFNLVKGLQYSIYVVACTRYQS